MDLGIPVHLEIRYISNIFESYELDQERIQLETMKTKYEVARVRDKDFNAATEMEIRTIIFTILYIILENNPDISSYTFSTLTICSHQLAKKLRVKLCFSETFFGQII